MKLPLAAAVLLSLVSLTGCSKREIRVHVRDWSSKNDVCGSVDFGYAVQKGATMTTIHKADAKPLDAKVVMDEHFPNRCIWSVSVPAVGKDESFAMVASSEAYGEGSHTVPGSILDAMTKSETPTNIELVSKR